MYRFKTNKIFGNALTEICSVCSGFDSSGFMVMCVLLRFNYQPNLIYTVLICTNYTQSLSENNEFGVQWDFTKEMKLMMVLFLVHEHDQS